MPANLWVNELIGGAGSDPYTRCLRPELLSKGWALYLRDLAARVRRFGATRVLLRNPWGTGDGMDFDQLLRAHPEFGDRCRAAAEFQAGVLDNFKGIQVWAYLGSAKLRPYWSTTFAATDAASRVAAVAHIAESLRGIAQCCTGVVIDGAGSDASPGCGQLVGYVRSRGLVVGCEPRPTVETIWQRPGTVVSDAPAFTQSDYFRAIQAGIPGVKFKPLSAGPQVVFVEESPDPPLAFTTGLLRTGIDAAVPVDEAGRYQGLSADEIRRRV